MAHAPGRDCTLRLRLCGEEIDVRAAVPGGRVRLVDVLPAVQALTDAVVGVAVRQAEGEGRAVTCREGCGACCRQPVPVAELEAVLLAELVGGMPPDRQAIVRARFREGIARLEGCGLLDAVRGIADMPDGDPQRELGVAYFRQQIPCPFLDAEACSIHPHRPLACREYLVTSPAARCGDPDLGPVERVALPGKVSHALYRFGDGAAPGRPRWLPLLLSLEWAERHRGAFRRRRPGPELFGHFLRYLAGT